MVLNLLTITSKLNYFSTIDIAPKNIEWVTSQMSFYPFLNPDAYSGNLSFYCMIFPIYFFIFFFFFFLNLFLIIFSM